MTNFNLISAKEITEKALQSDDPAYKQAALEYAVAKHAFLTGKGKMGRARLWVRAINALQSSCAVNDPAPKPVIVKADPEPEPEAQGGTLSPSGGDENAGFVEKYRNYIDTLDQRRKARGMLARKVDGATMWVHPTEFWRVTKNGFDLTEAARQRGIAAITA